MAWLKERLKNRELLILPGVFDAISAKLVKSTGFEAAYCSGFITAASAYGLPDVGLLDASEMRAHFSRISAASELPVIVDGDTGYGGTLNVYRTVKLLAQIGVTAVHIEDQRMPKKCGHLQGKEVVERSEAYARIASAVEAGEKFGVDIIARTDAMSSLGFEEAIVRSNKFLELGAAATFVDGLTDLAQIKLVPKVISGPVLFNAARFRGHKSLMSTEISSFGYSMAIFPGDLFCSAMTAVEDTLKKMRKGSYSTNLENIDLDGANQLTGQNAYLEKENKIAKRFTN